MAISILNSRGRALAAIGAAAVLVLAASSTALAVIIENQDDKAYHYTIQSFEIFEEADVAANETTDGLCIDCVINIRTIGSFVVGGSQRIVIKDGKATVLPE